MLVCGEKNKIKSNLVRIDSQPLSNYILQSDLSPAQCEIRREEYLGQRTTIAHMLNTIVNKPRLIQKLARSLSKYYILTLKKEKAGVSASIMPIKKTMAVLSLEQKPHEVGTQSRPFESG